MTMAVAVVDGVSSILEEVWFSCHTVGTRGASKIVNYPLQCRFSVGVKRGKHVILTLCIWNAVKAIGYAVGAPAHHDASSESSLSILTIVF